MKKEVMRKFYITKALAKDSGKKRLFVKLQLGLDLIQVRLKPVSLNVLTSVLIDFQWQFRLYNYWT